VQRFADIMASLLGLVVLSPLFLVVAIAVKISSPGPVFFRQERTGRHGRNFRIFKFRTMVVDAAGRGSCITVKGDARVTRIGHVLRKFKLDELPQLLNVLRGEMSLVGPRPEMPQYVAHFPEEFATVLKRRPGITHRASLIFRDEEELLVRAADLENYYLQTVLPRKLTLYLQDQDCEDFGTYLRTIVDTVFCVARVTDLPSTAEQVLQTVNIQVGQESAETMGAHEMGEMGTESTKPMPQRPQPAGAKHDLKSAKARAV